ncbi:hypothetical protein [Comamonas composti]|uniref:hypothetical protein n=1 Tax=Comamonas composti TaxID=408558 RepID=UPI0004191B20|nr:hypothetical protein [Comamonas composti]
MSIHPAAGDLPFLMLQRPEPASLSAWEELARQATQHLQTQPPQSVLPLLFEAQHMAQRLMASPQLDVHPDHCLAAWVVSHHNLADVLSQCGQQPLALEYLCDAHLGLADLAERHASAMVQQAALRHLRETRAALLLWQRQHGTQAQSTAALQAANGAAPHAATSSRLH